MAYSAGPPLGSVETATLGEHPDDRGDPLRPRGRRRGGVHPPEDGVPVGPVERVEFLLRRRLRGERGGEVVRDGDRGRSGVGPLPPAVGLGRLDRGDPRGGPPPPRPSALAASPAAPPAGRIPPAAASPSTAATFFCDHTLRGRRGVSRSR